MTEWRLRRPGAPDLAVVAAYALGAAAFGVIAYLLSSRAAAFVALGMAIAGVAAAAPVALRAPADSDRRFFAAAAMALGAVAAVTALVVALALSPCALC